MNKNTLLNQHSYVKKKSNREFCESYQGIEMYIKEDSGTVYTDFQKEEV